MDTTYKECATLFFLGLGKVAYIVEDLNTSVRINVDSQSIFCTGGDHVSLQERNVGLMQLTR
jgi:hypothetical protein